MVKPDSDVICVAGGFYGLVSSVIWAFCLFVSYLPILYHMLLDAAVPAITAAEISTSCDGVSRAKALKQPGANHRALQAKPKGHGKLGQC